MNDLSNTTFNSSEANSSPQVDTDYEYSDPHPATVMSFYIWTHIPPAMWVLGTLGNILTIIVFSRKGMRESMTSILFRALAVFDTLAMLESLESVFVLSGFSGIASSKIACKICYFLLDASKGKFINSQNSH